VGWRLGKAARPDAAVIAAIGALPERQRLVLFLRYYADLDHRGIATALGIRPGTVGAALHEAHRSVRNSPTSDDDPRVRAALERLLPSAGSSRADWHDVTIRAARSTSGGSRLRRAGGSSWPPPGSSRQSRCSWR
jgi:hypothetical protein